MNQTEDNPAPSERKLGGCDRKYYEDESGGQQIPGGRVSERVLLRSWDRPHVFELDVESGHLTRHRFTQQEPGSIETSGFVKPCVLGEPLAVYERTGTWYLQIGRRRGRLADAALKVIVKKWVLGRRIKIEGSDFCATCRMSDLGFWLARKLDPTYDRLDHEVTDFPLWLAERRAEVRRRLTDDA